MVIQATIFKTHSSDYFKSFFYKRFKAVVKKDRDYCFIDQRSVHKLSYVNKFAINLIILVTESSELESGFNFFISSISLSIRFIAQSRMIGNIHFEISISQHSSKSVVRLPKTYAAQSNIVALSLYLSNTSANE